MTYVKFTWLNFYLTKFGLKVSYLGSKLFSDKASHKTKHLMTFGISVQSS